MNTELVTLTPIQETIEFIFNCEIELASIVNDYELCVYGEYFIKDSILSDKLQILIKKVFAHISQMKFNCDFEFISDKIMSIISAWNDNDFYKIIDNLNELLRHLYYN